ncbi:MAG TPA: hypothetical protein VFZ44_11880 [Pyrinomonadaceae bacterium]
MKNLVMGLVKGYSFEQLRPFVASLRETGYDGDICLFYADIDERTLAGLREYDVELVPFKFEPLNLLFKRIYPYAIMNRLLKLPRANELFARLVGLAASARGGDRNSARYSIAARFLNVYCIRFPLYYVHLARNAGKYANVLISDVRDVIFQRDPFDFDLGDEVCVFLEDPRDRIRDCRYNTLWLERGFGPGTVEEVGDNLVSCSGVTLGSYRAMMHYLEVMNEHLLRLNSHPHGMDQGVHNYVLYKQRLKGVRVFENGRGPVLTMGKTTDLPTRFDERGRVLNDDGTVPGVLHQYDRHIELNRLTLDESGGSVRLRPVAVTEGEPVTASVE